MWPFITRITQSLRVYSKNNYIFPICKLASLTMYSFTATFVHKLLLCYTFIWREHVTNNGRGADLNIATAVVFDSA